MNLKCLFKGHPYIYEILHKRCGGPIDSDPSEETETRWCPHCGKFQSLGYSDIADAVAGYVNNRSWSNVKFSKFEEENFLIRRDKLRRII